MAAGPTTFRAAGSAAAVADRLTRRGVDVGPVVASQLAVLDTFDGRLARAGLRLTTVRADAGSGGATSSGATSGDAGSGGLVVTLGGAANVAASVTVDRPPRVADDLPAGPLRARVAEWLGVRVLLPLLEVSADRAVGARTDPDGKIVVHVTLLGTDDGAGVYVTVVPLVGYEQEADDLVAELIDADIGPAAPGDAPDLLAAARGVDLAGTVIEPGIALDPEMSSIDGFRAVLANLRDALVVNRPGAIAATDPEFLHDLRVAVRRTRAVLAHAGGVLAEPVLDAARDDFTWLGRITGPARDLDVAQIEWPAYVRDLDPAAARLLEPVREHLAERRRDAHATLAEELGGRRADATLERWSSWLDAPVPLAQLDAGAARRAVQPLGDTVSKRIRRAARRLVDEGRAIGPGTPAAALHELRKDAKKLRYLLECFAGLYDPRRGKQFVKRLKSMQELLGEFQDAEVHAAELRGVADAIAPAASVDTMLAIGQLIERMDQRRREARDQFADRFATFDSAATRRTLRRLVASHGDVEGGDHA